MAAKRTKTPDDANQSAQFIETARKLECDETGALFKRAVGVVAVTVKRKKKRPKSRQQS